MLSFYPYYPLPKVTRDTLPLTNHSFNWFSDVCILSIDSTQTCLNLKYDSHVTFTCHPFSGILVVEPDDQAREELVEGSVDGDGRGEDVGIVELRFARLRHELEGKKPLVERLLLQALIDDQAEKVVDSES